MLSYKRAIFLAIFLSILVLLHFTAYSPYRHTILQISHKGMTLRDRLSRAFPYNLADDLPTHIWQTWKHSPSQEEFEPNFQYAESSWATLNPSFQHEVITDEAATLLVAHLFDSVAEVRRAYEALPKPVLKADFFRYLILLARGGIYSDIDTTALKPAAEWIPAEMAPYGMAVGIEADPDRPDWRDWYARRIQFCQWTIMSKPGHPVLVEIVASITEETLEREAHDQLKQETMKTVMEFTGPGIWTDSLFNFFNDAQYSNESSEPRNTTWERFANLKKPMKEADIVVLPITSFSPDVGHMGAGSSSDPLAFVHHAFSGTWKHDERRDGSRLEDIKRI